MEGTFWREFFMQRAQGIVLTLVFAWHAVLGCCWHHAHASGDTHSREMATKHATCGHGHHHHDVGDSDGHAPVPHDCDKTACVYVKTSSSNQVDSLDAALMIDWTFTAPRLAPIKASVPLESPEILDSRPQLLRTVVLLI